MNNSDWVTTKAYGVKREERFLKYANKDTVKQYMCSPFVGEWPCHLFLG